MKYLFSPSGLKSIMSLIQSDCLYAFDFDGTLAKIVNDPSKASATVKTKLLLTRLTSKNKVAVISGRSIFDLKKRLGVPIKDLIGSHGLESPYNNIKTIKNAQKICNNWVKQINIKMKNEKMQSGITIENKRYSLAIHYRNSKNRTAAKKLVSKWIEEILPTPHIVTGKCVFNLIPKGSPNKGSALLQLMKVLNTKFAFYIGDDDTDEDVFTLPNRKILTVRIQNKKGSKAQFYLKNQNEIKRLLSLLTSIK